MKRSAPWLVVLAAVVAACAKPAGERPPVAPASTGSAAEPMPPSEEGSTKATTPGESASSPNVVTHPPAASPGPAASLAPERHGPALPELTVKSFGLHIGGSAADAAARAEFLRALEASAGGYLDCYRSIEEPGRAGTFGADLTIGGDGGKPHVGKPRTKLPGQAFQACMVRALQNVSLPRTPSGRVVVVSYSVKFSFADAR